MLVHLPQLVMLAAFLALAGTGLWAVAVMAAAGRTGAWWGMIGGAGLAVLSLALLLAVLTFGGVFRWQLGEVFAWLVAYGIVGGATVFCVCFGRFAGRVVDLAQRAAALEKSCAEKAAALGKPSATVPPPTERP